MLGKYFFMANSETAFQSTLVGTLMAVTVGSRFSERSTNSSRPISVKPLYNRSAADLCLAILASIPSAQKMARASRKPYTSVAAMV